MVREVAPDDVGISVSYPLPGTKFHQIVSGQLGYKVELERQFRPGHAVSRCLWNRVLSRALADVPFTPKFAEEMRALKPGNRFMNFGNRTGELRRWPECDCSLRMDIFSRTT